MTCNMEIFIIQRAKKKANLNKIDRDFDKYLGINTHKYG